MTDDLFSRAVAPPHTRADSPATSFEAADTVRPALPTIRSLVLAHALQAGARGFIDDDLVAKWEDRPESSFRKRRTELSQEGWIVDSGEQRRNRFENSEVVWLHRDFAASPPPLATEVEAPTREGPRRLTERERATARAQLDLLRRVAETQRKAGMTGLHAILVAACDELEPILA